jgi:uncharacterized protein YbjT (DUF2867 family)
MNVVTGAFGYTGKYIARALLRSGEPVITLTGNPARENEFGSRVKAFPFRFDNPPAMAESMSGARTLYNTYWVRFDREEESHAVATRNTLALIEAAQIAGVRRIVHISITNPSADSLLPYFRGKAILEREIVRSGISHAIIRPTVIFGAEDILVNNIAYLLRRLPLFLMPGDGRYGIQPVYVEDVASIAVNTGTRTDNMTIDAVGPETFSFEKMVRLIAIAVGSRSRIVGSPPWMALLGARVLGAALRDVMLTSDEMKGLMANLLVSTAAPTGQTRFTDWVDANAAGLGSRYASEVARHYASARS